MDGNETINGIPVTEKQIAAWVEEAEVGYDVEELKRRGQGWPGPGTMPTEEGHLPRFSD